MDTIDAGERCAALDEQSDDTWEFKRIGIWALNGVDGSEVNVQLGCKGWKRATIEES